MKRVGRYLLFLGVVGLVFPHVVNAQISTRDSLEKVHGVVLCDTTMELADSVLNALRTRKFASLKPYIASASYLKTSLDSMDSTSMFKMAQIRYNYNVNVIRKEYVKLQKDAKRHNLNLKKLEYEGRQIRIHEREVGFDYAEIFYYFKKKDQRYVISFLAVGILGNWFIHDQLVLDIMI